ncbi:GNAT family N-acetyltransferase [Nocardioides houyundeii]|uniref:GNAT family N-acetyltransferase n=1 Tax=Nocardioides houyundeii TaxID=2045452 RepID=UPI000DF1AD4C|nr:GNAT family N-acetyltransferase [Nocardioides houyundeii]
MGRAAVTLRAALPQDLEALLELWADVVRRATPAEQAADLLSVIQSAAASDNQRLLVAEYDGEVAGAVHLSLTSISPLNLEPVVHALSPHVLPDYRRRGVGAALMEAAVAFAEERGVAYVATAATSSSRDSNRFFARLAMGPLAVLRVAPTHTVRQRLNALRPARSRVAQSSNRHIDKVLAARRVRRGDRVSS